MTSKLFDLTRRAALVTGGSRGLGRAMAMIFAESGAAVVISSRHESELQAAAAEIRDKTGAQVEPIVADMTRREDVQRLADTAVAALSRVDILINNAGANPGFFQVLKPEAACPTLKLRAVASLLLLDYNRGEL